METPTKKTQPLISIILPTHNHNNVTLECLNSIEKLEYPKQKIEIIISDGASNDGSLSLLKNKIKKMKKRY